MFGDADITILQCWKSSQKVYIRYWKNRDFSYIIDILMSGKTKPPSTIVFLTIFEVFEVVISPLRSSDFNITPAHECMHIVEECTGSVVSKLTCRSDIWPQNFDELGKIPQFCSRHFQPLVKLFLAFRMFDTGEEPSRFFYHLRKASALLNSSMCYLKLK